MGVNRRKVKESCFRRSGSIAAHGYPISWANASRSTLSWFWQYRDVPSDAWRA